MSLEFLITALIVVVSPGTGVLFTLATGLSRGGRASVVAAFGCTLGIVPHMAAAILGLAALLHTSAIAFETLKYAGVAYLLWMAWMHAEGLGRAPGRSADQRPLDPAGDRTGDPDQHPEPQADDLLLRLPAAVRAGGRTDALPLMLELSAVFMLLTFVVFVGYGLFAASIRAHVISRPKVLAWMRRTFAAAFVALGAKLALAER